MPGEGFVVTIQPPASATGIPPAMVALIPRDAAVAKWGKPAAQYSDNTVRDEAGAVLYDGEKAAVPIPTGARYVLQIRDGKAVHVLVYADGSSGPVYEGDPPPSLNYIDFGAFTSLQVARGPGRVPYPVNETDTRDPGSAGGIAAGEQPNTDPLFIAGTMTPEQVYDNAADGGWGTPIASGGFGPPSSWSRRDDRWVWPDGRITDAQKTVLGYTSDIAAAARELAAHDGATPSITWTGKQVIYQAPAPSSMTTVVSSGGGVVTQDGTGRVVNAAPPPGSQTMRAVPPDAGWSGTFADAGTPAPIYRTDTPIPAGVTPGQGTDQPASGAGTALTPQSVVLAPELPSGDPAAAAAGEKTVPTWAIIVLVGLGVAVFAFSSN